MLHSADVIVQRHWWLVDAQVLHRFLTVYSTFNWDSDTLTVQGAVPLAAIMQQPTGAQPPRVPAAASAAQIMLCSSLETGDHAPGNVQRLL